MPVIITLGICNVPTLLTVHDAVPVAVIYTVSNNNSKDL